MRAVELRCEYADAPLGVDAPRPRLSWWLEADQRGASQTAYRILVASAPGLLAEGRADKWDTGRVDSGQSVNVPYDGRLLASGERCWWTVSVWDENGAPGPPSRPSTFEMGLLRESDWQGQWIGLDAVDTVTHVDGRLGQAIDLDGVGQTVRIPHRPQLKPQGGITLSAWARPRERADSWQEIYRKEDGVARHLLALGEDEGFYGLWCGLGIDGSYVERGAPVAAEALLDGEWHFVAATYDGSHITLYFDGEQVGQHPVTGALDVVGGEPAYIGSLAGGSEFFSGGIDDVRVYERALPDEEIAAQFLDPLGGPAGLVGWWRLDGDLTDGAGGEPGEAVGSPPAAAPMLRKGFEVDGEIASARAYVCGVGWYELVINGERVGDRVLDPATTDYRKRVLYSTYDVTDMLKPGANAIGAMLGNGWYSEPGWARRYGDSPRLLIQVNVEMADGRLVQVSTDGSWRAAPGPIARNDLFGGETYDARLERDGWASAGYDAADWAAASVKAEPGGRLESQSMPPIEVNRRIEPVELTRPRPGVFVYDLGQLFGGWARLRVSGPSGTRVAIKYSEQLGEDGLVDKRHHPEPQETDYYTLRGREGGETYEPRFTYHPVRYVQVEGAPEELSPGDLEGCVVHSSVDLAGDFKCSDPLLNRIHANVTWTLTNGLFGIPLDCLHREHWAWTDPATITGMLYPRKHMPLFWTKWLRDIRDAQRDDGAIPDICPTYPTDRSDPAWGGNYPILVWYLSQQFSDSRLLEEHYDSMARWLEYLAGIADGHIISTGHYGDHMLPGEQPGDEEFVSSETPPEFLWTGYYYRGASAMSAVARALGKTDDADRYARLAGEIRDAINARWIDKAAHAYATGSQTACVFPLALDIVPAEHEAGLLARIIHDITEERGGHLRTGNTGTTCMIDTLARHGHVDVMHDVVSTTAYPGWGYMVAEGATTIWESWSLASGVGASESMIMWATIDGFFYSDLAGIRGPDYYGPGEIAPGSRLVRIEPSIPAGLDSAEAHVKTVRGVVSSGWERRDDGLVLEVAIPANCRARVRIPKLGLGDVTVDEQGDAVWLRGVLVAGVEGVRGGEETPTDIALDVGSGSYAFRLRGSRQ